MSKDIFFKSIILGPMISGVSFTVGSVIAGLFGDYSGTVALMDDFASLLMWAIFFSYLFIFVSMFDGVCNSSNSNLFRNFIDVYKTIP